MGISFECVGVARELTLVNFFSFRLWGNKAILLGIWVDWTLAILFISFFWGNKGLYSEINIFVYILIRQEGVI